MSRAPRLHLILLLLSAAALAGCMTPQARPRASQAVLDARAHRNVATAAACPTAALGEVSPVTAGFPFNDSAVSDAVNQPLTQPAAWLACHPATVVVIKPDADGHGTQAEQDALAQARALAVRDYLAAHGVAADRIRILGRSEAEPAGEHFLIRAEGRRW